MCSSRCDRPMMFVLVPVDVNCADGPHWTLYWTCRTGGLVLAVDCHCGFGLLVLRILSVWHDDYGAAGVDCTVTDPTAALS